MKKRHNPILTALALLVCLALIAGAVYLLAGVLPKKAPAEVTSLETSGVFEQTPQTVEPEREELYMGELPAPTPAPSQTEQEPEPEPEPEPESKPENEYSTRVQQILFGMSREEKIWQLFFVTPEAVTGYDEVYQAGSATEEALQEKPVGGLIYFDQNLKDTEQVRQMLQNTQSYSKIPLFLGVDEEGGTVQRIGDREELGGQAVTSMKELGAAGEAKAVYEAGGILAGNLTNLGFNLDFAPVADVCESGHSVIDSRSFGSDPELVASLSTVLARSLSDHGVIPCLKHFPGYGSAIVDDHNGVSVVEKTREELEAVDLVPFLGANVPFIMVSHLSFPNVTGDDTPADLSPEIVSSILRNSLYYPNVIITDAQNMASITEHYSSGEAAVLALEAGCDMILTPNDLTEAYEAVCSAVESGRIPESELDAHVTRILTVKLGYGLIE